MGNEDTWEGFYKEGENYGTKWQHIRALLLEWGVEIAHNNSINLIIKVIYDEQLKESDFNQALRPWVESALAIVRGENRKRLTPDDLISASIDFKFQTLEISNLKTQFVNSILAYSQGKSIKEPPIFLEPVFLLRIFNYYIRNFKHGRGDLLNFLSKTILNMQEVGWIDLYNIDEPIQEVILFAKLFKDFGSTEQKEAYKQWFNRYINGRELLREKYYEQEIEDGRGILWFLLQSS